jgi:flagellar biosynthetic protein FliQ
MHTDVPSSLLALSLAAAAQNLSPLLVAILVTGLLISIFQVATQIQEMTLTFVPKLIVAGLVLALLGNWMLQILANLMQHGLSTAILRW